MAFETAELAERLERLVKMASPIAATAPFTSYITPGRWAARAKPNLEPARHRRRAFGCQHSTPTAYLTFSKIGRV